MIVMVRNPQSSLDQIGDPLCGPQLGPIPVGHRPLRQQSHKPTSFVNADLKVIFFGRSESSVFLGLS